MFLPAEVRVFLMENVEAPELSKLVYDLVLSVCLSVCLSLLFMGWLWLSARALRVWY